MQPADPKETEELAKVCGEVAQRSSRILADFAQKQSQSLSAAVRDEMGIAKAFMDLYARLAADPALMASVSMNLWVDYMRLWQSSWMRMFGMPTAPVAEPAKGDSRFKDDDWSSNFLFDYHQAVLPDRRAATSSTRSRASRACREESEKKVAFFTRQYVDALSPSNFAADQPAGAARDARERRPEPAATA